MRWRVWRLSSALRPRSASFARHAFAFRPDHALHVFVATLGGLEIDGASGDLRQAVDRIGRIHPFRPPEGIVHHGHDESVVQHDRVVDSRTSASGKVLLHRCEGRVGLADDAPNAIPELDRLGGTGGCVCCRSLSLTLCFCKRASVGVGCLGLLGHPLGSELSGLLLGLASLLFCRLAFPDCLLEVSRSRKSLLVVSLASPSKASFGKDAAEFGTEFGRVVAPKNLFGEHRGHESGIDFRVIEPLKSLPCSRCRVRRSW